MAEEEARMKTEIMKKKGRLRHTVIIKVKSAKPEFHQKNIYSN